MYDYILDHWNEKKSIKGKSFDDLFQIEGIPLSWFYSKFFWTHVIPRPINSLKLIEQKKNLSWTNKSRLYLNAKILKKYLWLTENKKIGYMKRVKTTNKDEKILLLSYTNHLSDDGNIFRLEGLLKEIRKDKDLKDFVLFVDPLSMRSYKKISGLPNLYNYYDKKIARKAGYISEELFKKWKSINKKAKYEMFKLKRGALWPYLKYPLDFFFSKEFFYFLILYYEIFKKIIINENIKAIIITGATSLFEKCLIAAAKQSNILLIRIDHGTSSEGRPYDLIGNAKEAVMSNHAKNELIKREVKKKDIFVVGPVVYDEIYKYINEKKNKEKNVLITTSPYIQSTKITKKEYFKRINNILKKIKEIPNIKVAFKLHPREKYYKEYQKIIEKNEYKDVKIFKSNVSRECFYSLIKWCDVFVHFGSNSMLEAIIINRPIVTIDILDGVYNSKPWFKEKGVTIEISYYDNIKKTIEIALEDNKKLRIKRKKFVEKFYGRINGKASRRIVNLIKENVN